MDMTAEGLRASAARALELWSSGDPTAARELLTRIAHGVAPDAERHATAVMSYSLAICVVGAGVRFLDTEPAWRMLVTAAEDDALALGSAGRWLMADFASSISRLEMDEWGLVCNLTPPPSPVEPESHKSALRFLLARVRAERSMNDRIYHRVLWAASEAGLPQREIAQLVEQPQTTVFRRLKAVEDDPELLSFGPRALHDAHVAGRIDRDCLLELLAQYPYAEGRSVDPHLDWSYSPASWDELAQLALEGSLSNEEYARILERADTKAATS